MKPGISSPLKMREERHFRGWVSPTTPATKAHVSISKGICQLHIREGDLGDVLRDTEVKSAFCI